MQSALLGDQGDAQQKKLFVIELTSQVPLQHCPLQKPVLPSGPVPANTL